MTTSGAKSPENAVIYNLCLPRAAASRYHGSVGSELKRKWSRLARMSWAEARTRLRQEGSKRLDLMLYRLGLGHPGQVRLSLAGSPKTYFFTRDADEVNHRATLLRAHLPDAVTEILQEADSICLHTFQLLGYEHIQHGSTIDWHSDLVHGKRSSLKPWYQIDHLDFGQVGDHKIIWELNRHQHLVTLAKAWRLTGNRRYRDELVQQWHSWHQGNPYPIGINWASALEAAFRSLSWIWVRELLHGCPDLPATFPADLLSALQQHGRYIELHLSTYFSPNTHLIGEAVALFFLGVLCPEIPEAERWKAKGWKIVLEETERQVRPDGVYFEQSLHYHVYALDFFLHARILASNNGCVIPREFDDVIRRMLSVVDALSEFAPPEGFGDDDGGRVFNPRRNRTEHMTDPLAIGSAIYGDQYAASRLTEESIWLFGDGAIASLAQPHSVPTGQSRAFSSGGIYLINDLVPVSQQMMIDAGPQGTGRSGHGHADALSVRMNVDSRRILVDPGAYCYISADGNRDRFRGTSSHNTLRVDNLDQAVPEGPFAWSSIPNVIPEKWIAGQSFAFFCGSHDGYTRLPHPVRHRRFVFHVKGGLWLVRDLAEGSGAHLLEISWHFASHLKVSEHKPQGMFTMRPIAAEHSDTPSMVMFVDSASSWKTESTDTMVSPAYGSEETAPLIRASITAELPQDFATLLLTQVPATSPGTFRSFGEYTPHGARCYHYQTIEGTEFLFFSSGNISWSSGPSSCGPWSSGPWSSDAAFLYCNVKDGRLAQVIMVAGSFAEYQGQRFVAHPEVVESFEWAHHLDSKAVSGRTSPDEVFIANLEFVDSTG